MTLASFCYCRCLCSRIMVWTLLLVLLPLAGLQAQSTFDNITSIAVEGNARVDEKIIRETIRSAPGTVSRQQINEDIKKLYQTGYFEQVQVKLRTEAGQSVLVYQVSEKPQVRKIFIKGNDEISEADLAPVARFNEGRLVDTYAISQVIRKVESYYQGQGYYDIGVSHSVTPVTNNQVDVTFSVQEGVRYHIEEIVLHGVENNDVDEILDGIQTKEYSFWTSWLLGTGRLNQEMLDNDKNIIRQYLIDHGYVDSTVSAPTIEKMEDSGLRIAFDIEEGPQYRIGTLQARGDLIDGSVDKTLEGIELSEGDVFNATQLRKDSFTIGEKFSDIGYAFVNVVPDTRVQRETSTIDVAYEVNQGKLVSINRISIQGNKKTLDNVIRRELTVEEQDTYNGSKLKRSELLLQRLGYFEEATITTEPVEGTDDKVDLDVRVREGSTGSFSIGAGFSSTDGALFNMRLSENNFLGTGRQVNANFDIGARRDNIVLSLVDRRFMDSKWALGASGLLAQREFTDFDRETRGGGLSAGYPLEEIFGDIGQDVNFNLRYDYQSITIDNVDVDNAADLVIRSQGNTTVSSVTPSFIRNTINNPLNPTSGSRQQISVELAGLGGSEEFYKLDASSQLYTPLYESDYGEFVFSWRWRFGYGKTFNGDDDFPLFRRYFPGGINSVRGFRARTLGPEDGQGNEFGGNKQLVNNLEVIFPVINSAGIKGVLFYDVGEAFDDEVSMSFGDLRQSYGYGIRWLSPLGPIRVEFGYPIDREPGEDSVVTQFSFGAPL